MYRYRWTTSPVCHLHLLQKPRASGAVKCYKPVKARFFSLISPSQPLALTKGFFCSFFYDLWRLERKFYPIFIHKVILYISGKIQSTEVNMKLCCSVKSSACFLVWVDKAWKYFQVPDIISLSLICA